MPTFSTGHVRAPDKDHLITLDQRRRRAPLMAALPAAYDAVAAGIVGPVKDQSNCGSCWDFSGTGMIEIAYAKAGIPNILLSEEYTLSCCRNGGCNGDDNGPYTARRGSCLFKPAMTLYKITDWGFCDNNGDGVASVDSIKQAIFQYGCAGSAIAADDAFMNIRPGSVFSGNSRDINHDIILVGWDDAKGAWKLRNSWGSGWVDSGYCWIKYGANEVGTEAVFCHVDSVAPPIDWFV
jgi:cathepsin K